MRRSLVILCTVLAALAATASLALAGSGVPPSPNEVLSIENAQGTVRITGRGYLNMRIGQGTVLVVDQSPGDRFSPYLGGVPRGKSSGLTGRDINLYVLGGRYKVIVRGTGINISARGDGAVVLFGQLDLTGNAGTIRIGDLVRPIAEGGSKMTFGGNAGDSSDGQESGRGSSSNGDRS